MSNQTVRDLQPAQSGMPSDPTARKGAPVFSGVIAYFPDALVAVAELSRVGNDQHNPGQPLHWAKEKSTDETDALMRHLIDRARGEAFDTDGVRHLAKAAWRALAALQREIDGAKAQAEANRRGAIPTDYVPPKLEANPSPSYCEDFNPKWKWTTERDDAGNVVAYVRDDGLRVGRNDA